MIAGNKRKMHKVDTIWDCEKTLCNEGNGLRGQTGSKPLTFEHFCNKFQCIIYLCDHLSNDMFYKDILTFLTNHHRVFKEKATDHYDYLINAKKLPDIKFGGKVVAAQPIMTNCTAITTEKLLCNHTM